jgi:phosphoglycolate phosphatase
VSAAFDLVLFDLDGTVWDSAPGIVDALTYTLAVMDLAPRSEDELASNLGPPLVEMLAGLGVPPERLGEGRDHYRSRYRTHGEFDVTVYPGIPELLDELREHGVRLATATSKGIDPTRRMLDHLGLTKRFDVIAGASMDESAHHKVDVIRSALAQADPAENQRVAMVGDRHYDLDGGRSFGLTTVGVRWGYGSADELEGCRPDHLVDEVADLVALLVGGGR